MPWTQGLRGLHLLCHVSTSSWEEMYFQREYILIRGVGFVSEGGEEKEAAFVFSLQGNESTKNQLIFISDSRYQDLQGQPRR